MSWAMEVVLVEDFSTLVVPCMNLIRWHEQHLAWALGVMHEKLQHDGIYNCESTDLEMLRAFGFSFEVCLKTV